MRKPDDTLIPLVNKEPASITPEEAYTNTPRGIIPMYDQNYVDNLKSEIEYYKKQYRDLIVAKRDCECS